MTYTVHDIDTAPAAAKQALNGAKQAFGFVPNLLGVMAEAPPLLKAYLTLGGLFDETSLTATERQVVLLTVSFTNGCEYCVAAHTVISNMQKIPDEIGHAIRMGAPLADHKLEALRRFTTLIVTSRGNPSSIDMKSFLETGYTRAQILEVLLGVGMKMLSNYTNHIAETPLDQAFMSAKWSKAD